VSKSKSHNDNDTTANDNEPNVTRTEYRDSRGTVVVTNVVSGNATVGQQIGVNFADFYQR
jgi:hypothetical protein